MVLSVNDMSPGHSSKAAKVRFLKIYVSMGLQSDTNPKG